MHVKYLKLMILVASLENQRTAVSPLKVLLVDACCLWQGNGIVPTIILQHISLNLTAWIDGAELGIVNLQLHLLMILPKIYVCIRRV